MTDETHLVVPILLKQNFKVVDSIQKRVTDIMYLLFVLSMLYLLTILDLYNNEVIACKVSDTQTAQLMLDMLKLACQNRNTTRPTIQLLGRSNTSRVLKLAAKEFSVILSISRKGNSFANTVTESLSTTYDRSKIKLPFPN